MKVEGLSRCTALKLAACLLWRRALVVGAPAVQSLHNSLGAVQILFPFPVQWDCSDTLASEILHGCNFAGL